MLTITSTASVTFSGARGAALADGFYVDDTLAAAVQTAGWRQGDGYRLRALFRCLPLDSQQVQEHHCDWLLR